MGLKRIFISHSSKDKEDYLRPLVEALSKYSISKQNIIVDELTFEEGKLIDKEITEWLGENTDLFVLLLSNDSLESEWVKKEILQSQYLEENSSISKIFPIIIDPNISYKDERIPEWLRSKYNIKPILSPWRAASKIINKRIEVIYELYPSVKKKHSLFSGRNDEIQKLEERYADFTKEKPISLIFSGLYDVGRKTCAKQGLSKLSIVKPYHQFLTIQLDQHQSIEDFIQSILDLGINIKHKNINLLKSNREQKINYSVDLLKEIYQADHLLQIIDNGTIVTYDRNISSWFLKLNEKLNESGITDTLLLVISKFQPNIYNYAGSEVFNLIFNIQVPLLSKAEINALFASALELNKENIHIARKDLAIIANQFNGYPREIINTVEFLVDEGAQELLKNPELINRFSDKSIKKIIEDLYIGHSNEKIVEINDLLAVLAMYDFISLVVLDEIITFEYIDILQSFISSGIIDHFGTTTEYLTMNIAIKSYITRQQWKPSEPIKKAIENHVINFINNYDYNASYLDQDLSNRSFSFKYSLKNKLEVNEDNMIPSYYLKAMKELYDEKSKDIDVVRLADKALSSTNYIDPHIINEIRFFQCSALARLKDNRFKEEVEKLSGSVYNFLYGFYYRQCMNYKLAISFLEKALEQRKYYAQAQRELVLCYIRIEEYDKAYALAKENYKNNESNEYHIQSFFKVTSFAKIPLDEKKAQLKKILEDISKIDTVRARNMNFIMQAEYELYFEDNIEKAKKIIDEATEEYKDNIYIKLFKIELYFRMKDIPLLLELQQSFRKHEAIAQGGKFYQDFKKLGAYILYLQDRKIEARTVVNSLGFSEKTKENLFAKLS